MADIRAEPALEIFFVLKIVEVNRLGATQLPCLTMTSWFDYMKKEKT